MKFRTEITPRSFPDEARIGYTNRILALGSCFADEMAARLQRLKFTCTANPTGVLFNPASIAATIGTFADLQPVQRDELSCNGDVWFHFGFHGSFADTDPDAMLTRLNGARQAGAAALTAADRILLTFGTAWVFERKGRIVANCHRRPAAEFVRRRLTVEEIVIAYNALLQGPLAGKQVILTVSPVRHLADGLEGNAVSKAVLRLAAEELAGSHPHVRYFPAYEILLDDLRDYRFYGEDLVHPAPQAVEYVWEKFAAAALTPEARQLTDEVEKIVAATAHRPQLPDSEAYRAFCRRQLARIDALPQMDWREERAHFEKYLG